MQKIRIAFLLAIAVSCVITAQAHAATKIEGIAIVMSVSGDVQMQKKGTTSWQPVTKSTNLKSGDHIKTGSASSCLIRWSGGNSVKLAAFTTMKIDKLEKNPAAGSENSSINMWNGKVYAKVNKMNGSQSSFEVRTPTAIAGVRGTQLSVAVGSDGTTDVGCFDGSVQVNGVGGGGVLLEEGQRTSVKKDEQPGPPEQLSQEEKQEFRQIDEEIGLSLSITSPAGDIETAQDEVMISGTTDRGNTLMVNGAPATVDEKGAFKTTVKLTEGDNDITVEATNRNGASMARSRKVKRTQSKKPEPSPGKQSDGTATGGSDKDQGESERALPLVLSISSPRDYLTTRDSTVAVAGTATPGSSVTVNGVPAIVSPSGTYTAIAPLIEGENQITANAAGRDGGTKSLSVTVIRDTTPPSIIVMQPGTTFGTSSPGCELIYDATITRSLRSAAMPPNAIRCEIIGRTESSANLIINNKQYQVETDGSFTAAVTTRIDANTIDIASTDQAGNRASAIVTRVFDETAVIDRTAVSFIEVSASPAVITSNETDTATIFINTFNLYREPVAATVTVTATSGGRLSTSHVITSAEGAGTVTFTAGAGGTTIEVVTISVTSGSISASTIITLSPDLPPPFEGN